MRTMIDCESIYFLQVLSQFPDPQMWAGYDTGTPAIKYIPQDWAKLPSTCAAVHIDQGLNSPPVTISTVRDVEPGAWSPQAAVDKTNWTVERPTIYCDQNDLERSGGVLDSGWKGDLWLAIPSGKAPITPPVYPGCTTVAVQWDYPGNYDASVVFDEYWPNNPPPIETMEQEVIILKIDGDTNTYLFNGTTVHHVMSDADEAAFTAAGLHVATITKQQFDVITGAVEAQ
jgi:hypothetical protein